MTIKSIVTGGGGFIGSHVVELLLKKGHQVLVVDNFSTNSGDDSYLEFIEGITDDNFFGLSEIDLTLSDPYNKEQIDTIRQLTQVFCGFDYVFHLAAHPRVQPSIDEPLLYHRMNVDSTVNVLEAARRAKIKKVIFSSSSSVYGDPEVVPTPEDHPMNPMSPYGLHKQIGEEYCKLYTRLYGLKTVCLRYMNVFGERQPKRGAYVPVIGIWQRQLEAGEPLKITGDGTQTRDFVYVGDVAWANYVAATTEFANDHEYFNIGSGANYEINEIASWYETKVEHIEKRFEPHTTKADISKFMRMAQWAPLVDLKGYVKLLRSTNDT